MIWNSVKHITFAELAAWILFLLVTAVLGSLGVRFASEQVSLALVVIWVVLFLIAYRVRYKRL
jgi:L-asparagine transporter-like permease